MPTDKPEQISTASIVFRGGKDVYHYACMHNEYEQKDIIDGFYDDIVKQQPNVPSTDAMRQACNEVDNYRRIASGDGRCKRVRANLDTKRVKDTNGLCPA